MEFGGEEVGVDGERLSSKVADARVGRDRLGSVPFRDSVQVAYAHRSVSPPALLHLMWSGSLARSVTAAKERLAESEERAAERGQDQSVAAVPSQAPQASV